MKPLYLPQRIRKHLAGCEDGANSRSIAQALDTDTKYVANTLPYMHDAYIDRWETGTRAQGGLTAVWMLHPVPPAVALLSRSSFRAWCRKHVPEDCPRPEVRRAA